MPPIKEERPECEPGDQALQGGRGKPVELHERETAKRLVPDPVEPQRDRHLDGVDRRARTYQPGTRGAAAPVGRVPTSGKTASSRSSITSATPAEASPSFELRNPAKGTEPSRDGLRGRSRLALHVLPTSLAVCGSSSGRWRVRAAAGLLPPTAGAGPPSCRGSRCGRGRGGGARLEDARVLVVGDAVLVGVDERAAAPVRIGRRPGRGDRASVVGVRDSSPSSSFSGHRP